MRILHCNTLEKRGGAARSASRIVESLKDSEVNAEYYYLFKDGKESKSLIPKIDAIPRLLFSRRKGVPFSTSIFSFGNRRIVKKYDPDIVHLHYINMGLFSIRDIGNFDIPVVWTLHDSWAFTGGCHLPNGCTNYNSNCENCPSLKMDGNIKLSSYILSLKEKHWRGKNITLVCPSNWIAKKAKESSLFEKDKIIVIPNPVNTNIFKPRDKKESRRKFNLEEGKKYILFGAINPTGDSNKGFKYLKEAISKAKLENTELLLLGTEEKVKCNIPVRSLGYIDNDKDLSYLYSAADLSVNSSLSENLPNVLIESLSCGTPCVGFDTGGIPEIIDREEFGIVVERYDVGKLARALEVMLNERELPNREQMNQDIKRQYGYSVIAEIYKDVYNKLSR